MGILRLATLRLAVALVVIHAVVGHALDLFQARVFMDQYRAITGTRKFESAGTHVRHRLLQGGGDPGLTTMHTGNGKLVSPQTVRLRLRTQLLIQMVGK